MPYVPRPVTTALCAQCNAPFEKRHASKKYCSSSCNVLAHYARNGRPEGPRLTRADLEKTLARFMELAQVQPELATTSKPAPKALPAKPAAKAAVKPAPETAKTAKTTTKPAAPAAKAAATKPKKKITSPAPPKPAAKAAATKPKKKITSPAPPKPDLFLRPQTPAEIEADMKRAGKMMLAEHKRDQARLKRELGIS